MDRVSCCKGWPPESRPAERELSGQVGSLSRSDEDLVAIVESMGALAARSQAELAIVDIPDGSEWKISDVLGFEFIVLNGKVY